MDEQLPDNEDKKVKKTRRTNLEAYGRTDLDDHNPIKNDENENAEQQKEQGGSEAQGGSDGNKGSGDPIHSLSA